MTRIEFRHAGEVTWNRLPGLYNAAGAAYQIRLWSQTNYPTPWVRYRTVEDDA